MQDRRIYNMALFVALLFLGACGGGGKQDGADAGSAADAAASEQNTKAVYGKVKEVSMDAQVNMPFAEKGEKIFGIVCSACHKYEERYVGPALGDVYTRRTPEYIMNMILDTEVMLEKDDTARCLLQEYLTKMPNAQVNETDARYVLEHLRVVAEDH